MPTGLCADLQPACRVRHQWTQPPAFSSAVRALTKPWMPTWGSIRRGLSMSGPPPIECLVPTAVCSCPHRVRASKSNPAALGAAAIPVQGIQETYRKIFHYAELEKVTA